MKLWRYCAGEGRDDVDRDGVLPGVPDHPGPGESTVGRAQLAIGISRDQRSSSVFAALLRGGQLHGEEDGRGRAARGRARPERLQGRGSAGR